MSNSPQNIIELGFNIEELTQEKKQVLDLMVDLFGKLKEYDGTKFNPLGGGGLADLKKSMADNAKAIADLQTGYSNFNKVVTEQAQRQNESRKALADHTAEQKAAKKVQDDLVTAQAKLNASGSDEAKQLAQIKLQQQLANAANKDAAKEALGLSGAYEQLKKTYDDAAKSAKQLGAANGTESEEYKTAAANAKGLHDQLMALEGDVGQFQRNVGNYSGAFVKAFEVLKEQLTAAKGQLGDLEAKGATVVNKLTGGNPIGFDPNRFKGQVTSFVKTDGSTAYVAPEDSAAAQAATQKIQLLGGAVERLNIGFKTTRQESRAFAETAVELGLALGQTDDKFLVFNEAVGEVQNGINDIKSATKFQASDAKFIVGLTSAVNGLVGAYGAASAAASILGGDEEEAQKSMAKFQQLLVLINGLQQVANTLQEESGAFQLALAAKTALASAATKINTIITTEAIAAIEAQVAANVALAASEGAVALTTEEAAAATVSLIASNTEATASAIGLSLAEDAVTVSAEAATGAVTGLGSALVASGVAVVVVAVAVAVGLLIVKIREWMAATELNAKQQKDLSDALGAQVDALQKINDLQDAAGKKSIEALQQQLSLEEKSGQNQFAIFAIKEKIAAKNAEIADSKYSQVLAEAENKYVSQGLTGIDALHKAQDDYFENLTDKSTKVDIIQKQYNATLALTDQQRKQQNVSDKDVDRIKARLDAATAERELSQKNYEYYSKGEKDRTDTQNEQANLRTEREKLSADEERKLILETARINADAVTSANALILNDDKSTQDHRLAAIRSNAAQAKKIADAELADVLNRPDAKKPNGEYSADALIALKKAADEKVKITADSLDQQDKVNVSYNDRRLEAQNAISKNGNESDAAVQAAITSDLQKELDARLVALKRNIEDKAAIIADDYRLQITLAKEHGKTDEEIAQIGSDRDRALVALTASTQKDIYDITVSYGEKKLKAIEDLNKATDSAGKVTENYNAQTDALNTQLLNYTISYGRHVREKRNLDRQYTADKDAADVADDEARLKQIQDFETKKLGIELIFAEKAVDQAKAGGNDKEIADAQAKYDGLKATQVKAAGDEVAINDKLNKDKKKQNADAVALREQGEKELAANVQQLEQKSFDVATSLVNGAYEARINAIQHTMELEDAAADNQIAAVQRSSLSQHDLAAETIILENQKQARDTSQKKEMAKEKQKEAKFDRDMSVAKAIWSTGEAIMKTFEEYGGTPIAYAVAASIAALGAVEVATILSQPIPTYAEGTGNHPGGLAWVGEEYKPEEVKIPGQAPFIVSTPTLLDMPGGSSVTPLEMQNIIHDIGWGAITRGAAIVNAITMDSGADQIVGALEKHGAKMERAFKKSQRKINNIVHVHVADPVWEGYLDQKVRGRR